MKEYKNIVELAQLDIKSIYGDLSTKEQFFYKNGFVRGYNQALQNLWHPIKEKPDKEKTFLYQTLYDGFGLNQISDAKDWKFIIKYQKVTKWLYIEDLIFKQKGGWND